MQTATIFNPQNDSLEARVKALKETKLALDNAEYYLQQNKTKGFDSVIGTKDEIEYAHSISKNSYKQAVKSLSKSDLTKAKEQKLLSSNEYSKLTIQKDRAKVREARAKSKSNSCDKGKSI